MRKCILSVMMLSMFMFAMACSDGAPQTGDLCSMKDYPYKSDCRGSELLTCENGLLLVERCEHGCTTLTEAAGCIGELSGTDCLDVPAPGLCDGNVLKRCFNGKLVVEDCSLKGEVCEKLAGKPVQCVKRASTEVCGDITGSGVCEGVNVKRCEGERLVSEACGTHQSCAVVSGVAKCVAGCGDIDSVGICVDNAVYRCAGGRVTEKVCTSDQICVPASSMSAAYCKSKVVSACGDITELGICDGKTLKYCSEGKIVTEHCSHACVVWSSEQFSGCAQACPSDFSSYGTCVGNTLKYCSIATDDKSYLFEDDCKLRDSPYCGFDSKIGHFDCIKETVCDGFPSYGICVDNELWHCESGALKKTSCRNELCMTVQKETVLYGYCTAPCGAITSDGICDGDVIKYCNNGKLHIDYCNLSGQKCRVRSDGYAECK